jgi:phosphohistidine swiveling domain-containing protein
MDDMDQASIKAGGKPSFFVGDLEIYSWSHLMSSRMGNQEKIDLYSEALTKFSEASQLPELFRTIFRAAFLPYRSPETLGMFLKEIAYFDYTHPEELGNAYEYLLSIMAAQGDAGQFRTPRHIIDFIVEIMNPSKTDKVLDPACGTAGFLVSTYNHILQQHDGIGEAKNSEKPLSPDERRKLMLNLQGYDIDPTMVRIAQRIESEQLKTSNLTTSKLNTSVPDAISSAVSQIAQQLNAAAILTLTKTGSTARNVSKFRPLTPILAITPHVDVARQLQLVWGVKPLLMLESSSFSQTFQAAINMAQERELLKDGDLVVMSAGTLQGVAGSTDLIKVEVVKAVLGKGTGIGHSKASGRARLALNSKDLLQFNQGEILVVPSTSAEFVEVMRKAGGIITEEDSLTSHAAIIGRRLGIPVIIGFPSATEVIRNGSFVTLDAQRGLVYSGTDNINTPKQN